VITFNRANGALGTNWTVITGGATIDTNVAETGGVGNDSASYWNADAFNGNHSSQIKVTTLNTDANKDVGVVLRAQSGATTYYEVSVLGPAGATAVIRIRKCSAGSNTSLNSGTFTVAAGDTFKADISGSTITAYVNGVSKLTRATGRSQVAPRGSTRSWTAARRPMPSSMIGSGITSPRA
jgi:hypothetical protein